MTTRNLTDTDAVKKLKELIDKIKVGMLATIQPDYTLYSRPMQTIEVDEEGNIWFFTNEFSEKADDISKDNTIYLMYAHPGQNSYLHIKGTAAIIKDNAKIEELWSPVIKAWFPKGKEDPALSLLKVTTNEASYWDSNSSNFVVFFNIVKAIAKGEKHQEGAFGTLDMDKSK